MWCEAPLPTPGGSRAAPRVPPRRPAPAPRSLHGPARSGRPSAACRAGTRSPLRRCPARPARPRLPHRRHHPAHERRYHERQRDRARRSSARRTSAAVPVAVSRCAIPAAPRGSAAGPPRSARPRRSAGAGSLRSAISTMLSRSPASSGGVARVGDHRARPRRLHLADDPHASPPSAARSSRYGRCAGQQLVEHHAERVDVGRGGDRLAAHLLGAGVVRASAARTPVRVRPARRRRRRRAAWRCRSRAASRSPSAVTRMLRRLEVAVHDEVAGARDCTARADLPEQRAAARRAERVRASQ